MTPPSSFMPRPARRAVPSSPRTGPGRAHLWRALPARQLFDTLVRELGV
ncbi:MAG: hypothetical protein GAK31_01733 [Stenotrophomonas maltophilia]|uniref:Uncharacterized protein n=1 Tax=Stenotrophomonas maltophilia TaxID=40324 RepID=A0A7V8JMK1_STEMA|nr:MAG: hypothetical protein GAK31_01733 [Stenotrophomonas maltophilia]